MLPQAISALGLFASNRSQSPVVGTIQDQALLNGVARQLLAWKVSVLIPEVYSPYLLGNDDYSNSPFFSNLSKLVKARSNCVQAGKVATSHPVQPQIEEIDDVIRSIDAFITVSLGMSSSQSSPVSPTAGHDSTSKPNANTSESANPAVSEPANAGSVAHLASVLSADRLARALGIQADGIMKRSSKWHQILWLSSQIREPSKFSSTMTKKVGAQFGAHPGQTR
jgi:hypothetical protein